MKHKFSDDARAAAMADLKAKVAELCDSLKEDAIEQLDHIQRAGVDIVADHLESGECYATPKGFMVAYGEQVKWRYRRPGYARTRSDTMRTNNYYRHMRGF